MNYDEALQKAVKLMRLAQSSNPHEAALAASRAQEIIDRFKIEAASLNLDGTASTPDEPIKNFGDDPIERNNKKSTWRTRLASTIAKENGCKIYLRGGDIAIIGKPSNVQAVRYFFAWLKQEIERLALRDCKGNGRTYINNYRLGVIDTISTRLAEQRKHTQESAREEAKQLAAIHGADLNLALVRVNAAIAKVERERSDCDLFAKTHLRLRSGGCSNMRSNDSARAAGRQAGNEIRMRPAVASIR